MGLSAWYNRARGEILHGGRPFFPPTAGGVGRRCVSSGQNVKTSAFRDNRQWGKQSGRRGFWRFVGALFCFHGVEFRFQGTLFRFQGMKNCFQGWFRSGNGLEKVTNGGENGLFCVVLSRARQLVALYSDVYVFRVYRSKVRGGAVGGLLSVKIVLFPALFPAFRYLCYTKIGCGSDKARKSELSLASPLAFRYLCFYKAVR